MLVKKLFVCYTTFLNPRKCLKVFLDLGVLSPSLPWSDRDSGVVVLKHLERFSRSLQDQTQREVNDRIYGTASYRLIGSILGT